MKNIRHISSIRGDSSVVSLRAAIISLNELARLGVLILLACLCLSADAQTGEWAWMGGSSILNCTVGGYVLFCDQPGVYGTSGHARRGKHSRKPRWGCELDRRARQSLALWGIRLRRQRHRAGLTTFGSSIPPRTNGPGWAEADDSSGAIRDLEPGVYGTWENRPPETSPEAALFAVGWTDSSGNFWLFGGYGLRCQRRSRRS